MTWKRKKPEGRFRGGHDRFFAFLRGDAETIGGDSLRLGDLRTESGVQLQSFRVGELEEGIKNLNSPQERASLRFPL